MQGNLKPTKMLLKKRTKDTTEKIRDDICHNIRGVNNCIMANSLIGKSFEESLLLCHPTDREDFEDRIKALGRKW
jgi:hypothetical protein